MHFLGTPAAGPYKEWADRYSKEQCLAILDLLIEWQKTMKSTPFKQVHLEMLLLTLVRNKQKIPLSTLVQRLLDLEANLPNQTEPTAPLPPPPAEPAAPPPPAPAAPAPAPAPAVEKVIEPPPPVPQKDDIHPSRVDTLMRFAAVELEGSVNTKT